MALIYHILEQNEWESACASGTYAPSSLDHEGFIHCSRISQLELVANQQFQGNTNLIIIVIDTDNVLPDIRYEDCYGIGERFPHVYGVLDVNSVQSSVKFPCDVDGSFSLPLELKAKTHY